MKSFSQNGEDLIVAKYFETKYGGDFKGNLLDIGANPTFSNATYFINRDWKADLVDASPKACDLLKRMWGDNLNVNIYQCAIGVRDEVIKFYESGAHLPDKSDVALLSSTYIQEKWKHLEYEEIEVVMRRFEDTKMYGKKYNLISLDVEGCEWDILKQMNLREIGCDVLIIEHNGDKPLAELFTSYCGKHGLKEIHRNSENLIFCLP